MQFEIPTFSTATTTSVKSFFDVVLHSRHGRKSSSVSKPVNPAKDDRVDDVIRVLSGNFEDARKKTPQEQQSDIIFALDRYIRTCLITEDDPEEKSCYLGLSVPPISMIDYIERLVKYVNQWAEDDAGPTSTGVRCSLLAIEYLDRSALKVTPRSVHRLFMTAVLLAVKFTEDFAISNKFWADVGGCKLEDVNRMEVSFCGTLNWNLEVSIEAYELQKK